MMNRNKNLMVKRHKSIDSIKESLKIAIIYGVFGAIWILLSDELMYKIAGGNQDLLKSMSLLKGWLFIIVTAGLVFTLVEKRIRMQSKVEDKLNKGYDELIIANEELSATKEELHTLAYYDALTHLPNRAFFEFKINKLFEDEIIDTPLSMIYFDIDDFKHINDFFGHRTGDEILKRIGEILGGMATENIFVARLGGDEFAILVFDDKDEADILNIMKALIEAFNSPFDINNHQLSFTISIGIVMREQYQQSFSALLRKADTALFYSKENGKNKYSTYSIEMEVENVNYMNTVKELKEAIANNEFALYYQPKLDINTNKMCGAEALIRWQHPVKGFISPAIFIPIAEKSGLIYEIEEWVFGRACRQMKEWLDRGIAGIEEIEDFALSVNLSGKRFLETDLFEKIESIVRSSGLDTNYLNIEITETSVIENFELAIEVLNKLRDIGIKIELDDFGKGYSSLSYLKLLPIDILKIDIDFIKNITTNVEDQSIVKTIINLAHYLDLEVTAEGIETSEQLDILINEGCDVGQGYYFHKPMSDSDIEKIIFKNEEI